MEYTPVYKQLQNVVKQIIFDIFQNLDSCQNISIQDIDDIAYSLRLKLLSFPQHIKLIQEYIKDVTKLDPRPPLIIEQPISLQGEPELVGLSTPEKNHREIKFDITCIEICTKIQTLLNFLSWLGKEKNYYMGDRYTWKGAGSKRDPYYISDKDLDKYWCEFIKKMTEDKK